MDEITAEIVNSLVKESLSSAANLGATGVAKLRESILLSTGRAFKRYYDFTRKKYGVTKTILYRTSAVRLYDFYVHLTLGGKSERDIDTHNTSTVLLRSDRVIITGTAGSGKSTLFKHFFLNSLNIGSHLPVFIELRLMNDYPDTSLIDFIYDQMTRHKLDISRDAFVDLLNGGKFLFLFDAFDELDSSVIKKIEKEIQLFAELYGQNAIIVSSRPEDRFISWHAFVELSVLPLTKSQALALIDKVKYESTVKVPFRKAVDEVLFQTHKSFLQNPLLLTLMLMTYDQFGDIPQKMHLFYAQAFDTLYGKHDATKGTYRREMASRLPADEFQDVLSSFSILTYFDRQTVFSRPEVLAYLTRAQKTLVRPVHYESESYLTDLLKSLCILLQDGLQYVFAHRTFQEYFAARYIIRSAPAHRRALLQRIQSSINRDSVFRLAWEMDRRAVEDDYLIEKLTSIRVESGFAEISPDLATVNFLQQSFRALHFGRGEGMTIPIGDISNYHILQEVGNLYDIPAKSRPAMWPTDEEVVAFCDLIRQQRQLLPDSRIEVRLSHSGKSTEPWRIPVATIVAHDQMREAFFVVTSGFRDEFVRAMKALELMTALRDSRDASIEEILGSPPSRTQKKGTKPKHK